MTEAPHTATEQSLRDVPPAEVVEMVEDVLDMMGIHHDRWFSLYDACVKLKYAESETAATTWAEEAAEDIESWASYASAYFQEKHDLAGTLKKWRDRANGNSSDSTEADK